MPTPLRLSDEEKNLLLALAQPIDQRLRPQFLAAVEAELEASGQGGGAGALWRVAARVQRAFWTPPESTVAGTPVHRAVRA
jgi:hypothetical protein